MQAQPGGSFCIFEGLTIHRCIDSDEDSRGHRVGIMEEHGNFLMIFWYQIGRKVHMKATFRQATSFFNCYMWTRVGDRRAGDTIAVLRR